MLIAPANPPLLAKVIVDDTEPPGPVRSVTGFGDIMKSGGTGFVTVMLWLVETVVPVESCNVN